MSIPHSSVTYNAYLKRKLNGLSTRELTELCSYSHRLDLVNKQSHGFGEQVLIQATPEALRQRLLAVLEE